MKYTISIIGCCASRDVFNSKFIKNYKDIFNLQSYYHQMSIVSIMSKSIPYEVNKLNENTLSSLNFDHLHNELLKPCLETLASTQPNLLILDFYADVIYGIMETETSFMTNKVYRFKDSKVMRDIKLKKEFNINKRSNKFFEIWKNSFDEFMDFVNKNLKNTIIIINGVKAVKRMLNKNTGKVEIFNTSINVRKVNRYWSKMDKYAIEKYGLEFIDFENKYYLDPDYPFGIGKGLVHFHINYYKDFYTKILKIKEKYEKRFIVKYYENNFNLIHNSSFIYEFKMWENWDRRFCLRKMDDGFSVYINPKKYTEKLERPQLWSAPIEIAKGCEEDRIYTLSFYVKIKDLKWNPNNDTIFCIRTFENKKDWKNGKAIFSKDLKSSFFNVKKGDWSKCEYTFKAFGKYLRVAPFLFELCEIEWYKIQVEHAYKASDYKLNETDNKK